MKHHDGDKGKKEQDSYDYFVLFIEHNSPAISLSPFCSPYNKFFQQ